MVLKISDFREREVFDDFIDYMEDNIDKIGAHEVECNDEYSSVTIKIKLSSISSLKINKFLSVMDFWIEEFYKAGFISFSGFINLKEYKKWINMRYHILHFSNFGNMINLKIVLD